MGIDFVGFCLDFVRFLAEGDPKNPQKSKPLIFEGASSMSCSERRYHLFRRHLTLVPKSSIGGKVTAERPLDDGGKGVSNVWDECK